MFLSDGSFFKSLRSIIKKMHAIGDKELTPLGISHAEMRILLLLYQSGTGCRQDSLYENTGIDRSNVGRALKKLEASGYIVRQKDAGDARVFRILVTGRGSLIKKKLENIKRKIESAVKSGISEKDFRTVSALIEKIDENFSYETYIKF